MYGRGFAEAKFAFEHFELGDETVSVFVPGFGEERGIRLCACKKIKYETLKKRIVHLKTCFDRLKLCFLKKSFKF